MESSSSTWRSISIMAASCGFSAGLTTGSLNSNNMTKKQGCGSALI
jgi:hypothetical protein